MNGKENETGEQGGDQMGVVDHEHESNLKKDAFWAQIAERHDRFLKVFGNNREAVLDGSSPMSQVFSEHTVGVNDILVVGCIDERCGHQGAGYHLGLGGAGILVPKAQQQAYVTYIIDTAVNKGVNTIRIYAHQGCGAARLSMGAGDHASGAVDQRAQWFTSELAKKVKAELTNRGVSDVEVVDGYLSSDEMLTPQDFHNAVGAIVDLTGDFDPTRKKEKEGLDFPPFFNVNGIFDYDHAMANIGVALNIAFGDHGFGSTRFNAARPFVITLFHNEEETPAESVSKLDQTVSDFVTTHQKNTGTDLKDSIVIKILKRPTKNNEKEERSTVKRSALKLVKQVLSDAPKVEALKRAVQKYTLDVDSEFSDIGSVISSQNTQVFTQHHGVGYMLWGEIVSMMERNEDVNFENLSEEKLTNLISRAYSNAGTSGF